MSHFAPSDIFLDAVKAGFDEESANSIADIVRNARLESIYELYVEKYREVYPSGTPLNLDEFRAVDSEKGIGHLFELKHRW